MNRLNIINREICSCKHKLFSAYNRCKSYYHSLGLDSTASAADIKAAYYKLSLQHHPDKNQGSEESATKFREITEAYETLSNPEKKKMYDLSYNFQPQYSSTYTRGPYQGVRRAQGGPFTGKTKDFDYDEHYRQHYENIKRQQEAEYEYFKRRWEAEFYRRYPTKEEYMRNRHRSSFQSPEDMKQSFRERRRMFVTLSALWMLFTLLAVTTDWMNPDKDPKFRKIYYQAEHRHDRSETETHPSK